MRYHSIARAAFGFLFLAGGVAHLVLGRTAPESYAVFGDTALVVWLRDLWFSFDMPDIGWLTLVLAAYEMAAGAALFARGRAVRWGAPAILAVPVFITVVGYGFPTAVVLKDTVKNRIITAVMAVLVLSLPWPRRPSRRNTPHTS
ncbi:hypothetical protein ACEE90_04775 [Corynebacterium phoceense]